MCTGEFNAGGNPTKDQQPIQKYRNSPKHFMLHRNWSEVPAWWVAHKQTSSFPYTTEKVFTRWSLVAWTLTQQLERYEDRTITYIVVNEIQIVTRSDRHHTTSSLSQPRVGLVQSLVNIHKCVDDCFSVAGMHGQVFVDFGEVVWWSVLQTQQHTGHDNL